MVNTCVFIPLSPKVRTSIGVTSFHSAYSESIEHSHMIWEYAWGCILRGGPLQCKLRFLLPASFLFNMLAYRCVSQSDCRVVFETTVWKTWPLLYSKWSEPFSRAQEGLGPRANPVARNSILIKSSSSPRDVETLQHVKNLIDATVCPS